MAAAVGCRAGFAGARRAHVVAQAAALAHAQPQPRRGAQAEVWWRGIAPKLGRLDRLQVWRLPPQAVQELQALAERSMQLQATLQDGALTLSSTLGSVHLEPQRWQ